MGGSFVVELARRATHKEGNVPRMRQKRMFAVSPRPI